MDPSGGTTYLVQPGDTLFRIATRFNTTVMAIAQANGILNVNLIRSGQQLTIPGTGETAMPPAPTEEPADEPTTYVVQRGDNLYRISLRFGVTMLAIGEANGILNANRIYAGQVLIIP